MLHKCKWKKNRFALPAADIYDKVSEELEKDGVLDCECIGGGRIKHDPQGKKIHVYGYSMVREYPLNNVERFTLTF